MSDRAVRPQVRRPALRERPPQPSRRPSRAAWAWGVAAGAVTGAMLTVRGQPDVDLWLHLRIGALLRDGGRFEGLPDPLAVLPDRAYVPTQWLAQVSMSMVYAVGGMTAIQVVRVVLVVTLVSLVLIACRAVAGPTSSVVATTMAAFATSAAWGERPQLIGMVLLAMTVALWWRAVMRGSTPWEIVPLTWLWACLHGSWVMGISVGALFVVGAALDRRWAGRRLLAATAVIPASLLAGCLTPLGVAAVAEPFRVSEAARVFVNEWQRPSLTNPLLIVVLVAAAVSLASLVKRSPDRWLRALMTLAATALALWMVRTIAVGAVVLAPALALALSALAVGQESARQEEVDDPVRTWPVWLVSGLLATGVGLWHVGRTDWSPPVSAAVSTTLASLSSETVIAVDGRAVGWVQLAHPDRRPLRDLRAEVYSAPTERAYRSFQSAKPGWQQYATAHGVEAILADREDRLDPAIARDGHWRLAAEDQRFRLWVHR